MVYGVFIFLFLLARGREFVGEKFLFFGIGFEVCLEGLFLKSSLGILGFIS